MLLFSVLVMHTFCEDRMISVPVTEHDSQLNFLTATASPFHCKKTHLCHFKLLFHWDTTGDQKVNWSSNCIFDQ